MSGPKPGDHVVLIVKGILVERDAGTVYLAATEEEARRQSGSGIPAELIREMWREELS